MGAVGGHVPAKTKGRQPPDPMAAYSIAGYRQLPGLEFTGAFYAWITLAGKPIVEALNNGLGEGNVYRGERAAQDALCAAAKAWFASYGYLDKEEAESYWLEWYIEFRPSGATAQEYIAEVWETLVWPGLPALFELQ